MCVQATWKNVCSHCEDIHQDERRRKVERGWCGYAYQHRQFGCCQNVETHNIQYAGQIEAFMDRSTLKARNWAFIEKLK